jgi:hypothetical protein
MGNYACLAARHFQGISFPQLNWKSYRPRVSPKAALANPIDIFLVLTEKVQKNQNCEKNESSPTKMVLLEYFGAEPLAVNLGWSYGSKIVRQLPQKVIQPVTPGIPK